MYPILLPIYGPLAIHSYGVAILIGFLLLFFLTKRKAIERKLVTDDFAYYIAQQCILIAIIMGKIVHYISERDDYTSWYDIMSFWDGGFSILGAMIGVFCYAPYILYKNKIPILELFDTGALYVALLHMWGRIGCFFAGCCGGIATERFSFLGLKTHPTQLYSSLMFLVIFIILRYIAPRYCTKPGQLTALYLLLASLERFTLDFLRSDRISMPLFSFHQWLALAIMLVALAGFTWCSLRKNAHTVFTS